MGNNVLMSVFLPSVIHASNQYLAKSFIYLWTQPAEVNHDMPSASPAPKKANRSGRKGKIRDS